ncbi:MAG: SHOCT domain-containing protein, partial [Lachnospiraceae bacterium]|nr:SHOCT domain-containing protein [Lachnospiraceae bacterium]
ATDIHGNYSSFGGSMTGGNFSKLAAVGGGLLFGYMGMAIGAALTYKPVEQKPIDTKFSIDSEIKKIDDRSVILNFYSDMKKQYIDIELPQDIYNFLQTYLPEKKYGIVDELEKKTVVHQSSEMIENGSLLKTSVLSDSRKIENKRDDEESVVDFGQKIEKLKMMQAAGLLSDEEFDMERRKLLSQI